VSDVRKVTERLEREEFARGHVPAGERPADPRPAATMVVACRPPGSISYRVLLLRRPDTTRFAPGAHVFPGGVIDASDASPDSLALLPPRLKEPQGTALVAALREVFEETALLMADETIDAAAASRVRDRLLEGKLSFREATDTLGATFHKLEVAYLSRWITPARFARRYDTRFFLVVMEAGEPPEPQLTEELSGFLWLDPAEAVKRFAAGKLPMLFPTRTTLQALVKEPDLAHTVARCAGREPDPIEPRLVVRGDSVMPVLPGDPEYETAGP
jgi:8-oxo-dGTP pyrophosphatase MutT (NUDIX family)